MVAIAIAVAPGAGAIASIATVEVPGVATVSVPSVPGVETPSLPTVKTPPLPELQLPPPPEVITPPVELPPVKTPEAPVEIPTKTTPSPTPTGSGAAARAASVGSTGSSRTGAAHPSASTRAARSGKQTARRTSASHPATATALRTATAVVPVAARTRASAHHSSSGSNPLSSLGKDIPLPLPVPDWSKPIILALALIALGFAVRSRLVSRRAKRLEGQRTALLEDVGAMQSALVPAVPALVGELGVSVAYRPAEGPAAGGDFYDVFELGNETIAVILGDVAGHGHLSLKQAALTRYTLRAYLQAGMEPRAALALAGSVLADEAAEHFATVVVAIYDAAGGRLTYASAGHPPPLTIGFDVPEPLTVCCSPPLGWDVQTGRRQTSFAVPAGGGVCFFSDGLIEARTEHGLLGREELTDIIRALGRPFDAVEMLAEVRAHSTATPDDMVSCIIAPSTVSGSGGHVEELEVDAAALSAGQARRFLEASGVGERQLETALARARDTVAASDTAVLRLGLDGAVVGAVSVHPGLALPTAEPMPSERIRARALAPAR